MLVSVLHDVSIGSHHGQKRKADELSHGVDDGSNDVKRPCGDGHEHTPIALPRLYHNPSTDHQGVACHLVPTASSDLHEPYEWTCEVCHREFPLDYSSTRQHCEAHSVDVCEACYVDRIASNQLEVTALPADDESGEDTEELTHDAHLFVEQEADETSADEEDETDSEQDEDSDQTDESDDDSSEAEDVADDFSEQDEGEQGDAVARQNTHTHAEQLSTTEVERLLRETFDQGAVVVSDAVRARLEHLCTTYPRSLNAVLDLCSSELHANGYGRVRLETDGALLAQFARQFSPVHVPALLRAIKCLLTNGVQHGELYRVLLDRARDLSPESCEALQSGQWCSISSRRRQQVREALVLALGDSTVSVDEFCEGALQEFQQTFPSFGATLQEEMLDCVARCEEAMALLALEKLDRVWTAYPLSGVTGALRLIASWTALNHAEQWRQYGAAIHRLIAQHVTAQHLDALVETCHAVLQGVIIYPLLAPLHTRLTEVAPPEAVAQFAHMHALLQVDVAALDVAADEADAREMAAESDEEPTEYDKAFVASDDDEQELADVVRGFAAEHINETGDAHSRVTANAIYQKFVEWFRVCYPSEATAGNIPSQKAFGNEFQLLYPNKVRARLVYYVGIMLRS